MTNAAERILSDVRAFAPSLAKRAPEIEAARRLPPELVQELKSLGLFRMLVPESHGGLEIEFPPSLEILATLAAADGATGWTVMIGCETAQLLALLPRASFDRVYQGGPDTICGGAFAPQGKAVVEPAGGYRASGRWGFASGCQHADWLFGQCVVLDGGAPVPGPMPGAPKLRCVVAPASRWQIIDTWQTAGMRGTGSHDIAIESFHADEDWTFDLWFGQPCLAGPHFASAVLQFSMHIGAVALGIAEGALADLVALAGTRKVRLYAKAELADQPLFQYRLGHAEVDARAARAFLHSCGDAYWAHAKAGTLDPTFFTRVLSTVAWVVESSTRIVDACYQAGGGSALYDKSPLQRRLRDIHTLTQHASVQEYVFMSCGAEKLGKPGAFGP
jgi:alkylation response protein AidB-like acyl-CoA dehydrogenase